MKNGYCLIQSKPDQTEIVCRQLLGFPEVRAVTATSGLFDLLAKVEVDNTRELQRFLIKVRNSPSIEFVSFFQMTKLFVPVQTVSRRETSFP